MKRAIKRIPALGPAASRISSLVRRRLRAWSFGGSAGEWESHYAKGGTSGLGSYGELARFKAEVINDFVASEGVGSVVEFGCGDGNQLALGRYPAYIGLDVSRTAVRMCAERFVGDPTKSFFLYDWQCFVDRGGVFNADLGLSLDVIFHLVEDDVFEAYMRHLFGAARRAVIVYSSNLDAPGYDPGLRHRRWSNWVERNALDWIIAERIPNRFPFHGDASSGSHSDFYICRPRAATE